MALPGAGKLPPQSWGPRHGFSVMLVATPLAQQHQGLCQDPLGAPQRAMLLAG